MNNGEKEKLLHYYCDNEAQNLKKLTLGVLKKLGRNGERDLDEFYSIANIELFKAVDSYIEDNKWGATFTTFLSGNLIRRFITEIKKQTRIRKINDKEIAYLDDKMAGLDNVTIGDSIMSDVNTEKEALGELSDGVSKYLASLSPKQRRFAELIMDGYNIGEASKIMNISKTETDNMLKFMRRYEKKELLNRGMVKKSCEGEQRVMEKHSNEKSKIEKYSVGDTIREMDNKTLNFEHPLQRPSLQWDLKTKSNLISDILQNNPITPLIFAEKIMDDGVVIKFNLDGKQRCTTIREYVDDAFKISKSVSRSIIRYQKNLKDENGKPVLNEKGYPVCEWIDYDISNKKFSQLPCELQNKIKSYNFDVTLYLNCSDEEIAYHIQRYNQGKPMNVIQKGFTFLGEDFAREIKQIAAMPLFLDSGFTFKQFNKGEINRVILESVMVINFIDDWKKTPEEIAKYLNKNATIQMFEDVEDSIERIQKVISDETVGLFDIKNTFLWLALFDKFKTYNIDDSHFNDFLLSFIDELQYEQINGNTFNQIEAGKNTKDKSVLTKKLAHLESLMKNFLFEQCNIAS